MATLRECGKEIDQQLINSLQIIDQHRMLLFFLRILARINLIAHSAASCLLFFVRPFLVKSISTPSFCSMTSWLDVQTRNEAEQRKQNTNGLINDQRLIGYVGGC
jgi:hypothetical protein